MGYTQYQSRQVNVAEFVDPTMRAPLAESETPRRVTIGDMHASALKFLWFLLDQQVISMSKADFDAFSELYQQPVQTQTELSLKELQSLLEIINKIDINNRSTVVSLLGDLLADRGSNDLLIIAILQKLNAGNVPFEILLSNHDLVFLNAYLRKFPIVSYENRQRVATREIDLGRLVASGNFEQYRSLANLGRVISDGQAYAYEEMQLPSGRFELVKIPVSYTGGLISITELGDFVRQVYLPHLKAISYSLGPDGKSITLLSHAPIGLQTIEMMARDTEVSYSDDSPLALALTIEQINVAFIASYEKILTTVFEEMVRFKAEGGNLRHYEGNNSFIRASWSAKVDIKDRVAEKNGFTIMYQHGHDGANSKSENTAQPGSSHIINLDNNLSKYDSENEGVYDFSSSAELDLWPFLQSRVAQLKTQVASMRAHGEPDTSIQKSLEAPSLQSDIEDIEKQIEQKNGHEAIAGFTKINKYLHKIGLIYDAMQQIARLNSTIDASGLSDPVKKPLTDELLHQKNKLQKGVGLLDDKILSAIAKRIADVEQEMNKKKEQPVPSSSALVSQGTFKSPLDHLLQGMESNTPPPATQILLQLKQVRTVVSEDSLQQKMLMKLRKKIQKASSPEEITVLREDKNSAFQKLLTDPVLQALPDFNKIKAILEKVLDSAEARLRQSIEPPHPQ
ncbi:MAG: metallophosphoesterase [Legionellaceae bacterium]|nr:metallophosphoesterase [Legionellaceae bacterium]